MGTLILTRGIAEVGDCLSGSRERDEGTIDGFGLPTRSGWMSRALAAITADLRLVDSGSLDVLLYCTDDVAVGAPGDTRLIGVAHLA